MNNNDYEQLLAKTVDQALLHLWLTVASSRKHIPRPQRNQILIRWLKPKVKMPRFKIIKNELKSMISTARHPNGHLEKKLSELRDLSEHYRLELNDVYRFHQLLSYLKEHHAIDAHLYDEDDIRDKSALYFLEQEVNGGFSENNQQIAPICASVYHSNSQNALSAINKNDHFFASLSSDNNEGWSKIVIEQKPTKIDESLLV